LPIQILPLEASFSFTSLAMFQTPIIDDTISMILLFPASFTERPIKQSLKPNTSAKRGTYNKPFSVMKTLTLKRGHISNNLSLTQHLI
jgi:hypothetical protein